MTETTTPEEKISSSHNIKAIDVASVHRICSGQVVLDLATAIKELIENSVDAAADNIEVRIRNYGLQSIEVSDNGTGIKEENFTGIGRKHWTSKLSSFEDLESISSFGFRGEAISSLCALCESVVVITRTAESSTGTTITFNNEGEIISKTLTARNIGTTVILNNLFSSLPVRRKAFEKSCKTEFSRTINTLHSYALILKNTRLHCVHEVSKSASTQSASPRKATPQGAFNQTTITSTRKVPTVLDNYISLFGRDDGKNLEIITVDIAQLHTRYQSYDHHDHQNDVKAEEMPISTKDDAEIEREVDSNIDIDTDKDETTSIVSDKPQFSLDSFRRPSHSTTLRNSTPTSTSPSTPKPTQKSKSLTPAKLNHKSKSSTLDMIDVSDIKNHTFQPISTNTERDTTKSTLQGYSVEILISKLTLNHGRSSGDRQFIYLNGRPVTIPAFQRVISDTYRTYSVGGGTHRAASGVFPVFVMNITVPPGCFDVNITPNKREVLIHHDKEVIHCLKLYLTEKYEKNENVLAVSQSLTNYIISSTTPNRTLNHTFTYPIQNLNGTDREHDHEHENTKILVEPLVIREGFSSTVKRNVFAPVIEPFDIDDEDQDQDERSIPDQPSSVSCDVLEFPTQISISVDEHKEESALNNTLQESSAITSPVNLTMMTSDFTTLVSKNQNDDISSQPVEFPTKIHQTIEKDMTDQTIPTEASTCSESSELPPRRVVATTQDNNMVEVINDKKSGRRLKETKRTQTPVKRGLDLLTSFTYSNSKQQALQNQHENVDTAEDAFESETEDDISSDLDFSKEDMPYSTQSLPNLEPVVKKIRIDGECIDKVSAISTSDQIVMNDDYQDTHTPISHSSHSSHSCCHDVGIVNTESSDDICGNDQDGSNTSSLGHLHENAATEPFHTLEMDENEVTSNEVLCSPHSLISTTRSSLAWTPSSDVYLISTESQPRIEEDSDSQGNDGTEEIDFLQTILQSYHSNQGLKTPQAPTQAPPQEEGNTFTSRETEDKNQTIATVSYQVTEAPTINDAIVSFSPSLPASEADEHLTRTIQKDNFLKMNIIGQFNLGFIITSMASTSPPDLVKNASPQPPQPPQPPKLTDLYIIDQHASDEKFRYETLWSQTVLHKQKLLVPQRLDLSYEHQTVLREFTEIFNANGFDFTFPSQDHEKEMEMEMEEEKLEDQSHETDVQQHILLTQVPYSKNVTFASTDLAQLCDLILDHPVSSFRKDTWKSMKNPLNDSMAFDLPRMPRLNYIFASRACRSAVMIGTTLGSTKMSEIVQQLATLQQPWSCPHGRPTMRHLLDLQLYYRVCQQKSDDEYCQYLEKLRQQEEHCDGLLQLLQSILVLSTSASATDDQDVLENERNQQSNDLQLKITKTSEQIDTTVLDIMRSSFEYSVISKFTTSMSNASSHDISNYFEGRVLSILQEISHDQDHGLTIMEPKA